MILVAAASIAYTAVGRLRHPAPLADVGWGLVISTLASLLNLGVARVLLRASRAHHSITLEADAQHLLTDVWTSLGVMVGVAGVALTGWERLDPFIALAVAANIVWTGARLVRRSALGLLDTALPAEERAAVEQVLARYAAQGLRFHALRTRQAGARRFVSLHILVPGRWTVQHGHTLLEAIEAEIRQALPTVTVFTHLEPLEDPSAWEDTELDRRVGAGANGHPVEPEPQAAGPDRPA